MSTSLQNHPVVDREQWLQARKQHLSNEKALTRQRDRLAAERRALPWLKIHQPYAFSSPEGTQTLSELFGAHSQLVVYHFMFGAGWEEGCKGCSFLADHLDGANLHLAHHDVAVVAVSHAPWEQFQSFRQRMGWHFKWVSSAGTAFNYDFGVSADPQQVAEGSATYNFEPSHEAFDEMPGLSVFYKDAAGDIFLTYSTYARGLDLLVGAYNYLDLTPKGRNEQEIMDWMRLHDQYDDDGKPGCCGH